MQHLFDGYNDIIRLQKGEKLSEVLAAFIADNNITGAWITGLGGASHTTLGFYNMGSKSYTWRTFDDVREIVSLQGNIAAGPDGAVGFHLHGTFADNNFMTVGGHVKDFTAAATVELFVHRTYKPLKRAMDDDIGLPLLDLS